MREVNFSIPNVNKASVGITTALYDRRALDCTSTLPLINSLNHLAYLTMSSARIREILTQDGGIERLICILKQGRSRDMMGMWKWNLAFQCVVNIGVRGTEDIRTRVVEADMVPVIATLLDSYNKVVEKCRDKAEEAKQKQPQLHQGGHRPSEGRVSRASSSFTNRSSRAEIDQRTFRRQAPPPSIDVSATYAGPSTTASGAAATGEASASAQYPLTTPPDRSASSASRRPMPATFRSNDGRLAAVPPSRVVAQPLTTAIPSMDHADGPPRSVHQDLERLGSVTPFGPGLTSQPTSPTTPLPPAQVRSPTVRPSSVLASTTRSRRRPSIRHQTSTAESDDLNGDSMQSDESPEADLATATGDMQTTVGIQDISMEERDSMLAETALQLTTPTVSETQDTDTFNITHRGPIDGSINTPNPNPVPTMGLSPTRQTMVTAPQPAIQTGSVPRFLLDRHFVPPPEVVAAMPRDEDVLMSLQLLAYISKYCGLRSYFQKSHLVPRLKIGRELRLLDGQDATPDDVEAEKSEEEYLLPNDFNIFPLVEKFTVRLYTPDMQYWAGVVMRNLCRKDDTRGGIRQCAYYQCGKWEEFTRQFAKCRRCRRTKYCSKECQKSAWAFHRHWCVSASQ